MLTRFVVSCILACVLCAPSRATTVLIVETEDGLVYVAADSLQGEASDPSFHGHICKIQKLNGNSYWAAATNFYADTRTGFSIRGIINAIDNKGSLSTVMQRFIKEVTSPLEKEVAGIERENPAEFKNYIAGTHTALEIVFVQIDESGPHWAITRFFIRRSGNTIALDPRSEPRLKPPSITGAGYWGPAAKYVLRHASLFASDPTRAILAALQRSADQDLYKGVGPPYSVLRLDARGAKWTQPGLCQ